MPPMPKERDKRERKDAVEKFQKAVGRMTNSPGFSKALEAFEEDPDSARADPKGFLKRHGVDLPDEATVEIVEQEGSYCYCIRTCFLWWCATWCVCV